MLAYRSCTGLLLVLVPDRGQNQDRLVSHAHYSNSMYMLSDYYTIERVGDRSGTCCTKKRRRHTRPIVDDSLNQGRDNRLHFAEKPESRHDWRRIKVNPLTLSFRMNDVVAGFERLLQNSGTLARQRKRRRDPLGRVAIFSSFRILFV